MKPLVFWFEFASTYSYLSVMRIEALAAEAGVDLVWRPFLLGPIFAAQGWTSSPFNIYPAKGAYMFRDLERRAAANGLSFQRPDPFPQNGLLAARVAHLAVQTPQGPDFVRAVYNAEFADGAQIDDPAVITACLKKAGLPESLLEAANAPDTKAGMKATVAEAQSLGIFGAPSFTVGEELFWGDDRLDEALAWAMGSGSTEA